MSAPRKDIESPLEADWPTLVGLVLIVVVGCVANTAGVGGGAIFVPLFQSLVGFGTKESTALSQALITAGSVVSVLLNLFTPSPVQPWRPLIDFSLVLLLLPVLLVGVSLGVLLSVVLPSYIISVLLFLLMLLLIAQSLGKGIHMWRLETKQQRLQQQQPPPLGSCPAAGALLLKAPPAAAHLGTGTPGILDGGHSPDVGSDSEEPELGKAGTLHDALVSVPSPGTPGSPYRNRVDSSRRGSGRWAGDGSRRGGEAGGRKVESWRSFRPDAARGGGGGDPAWFRRRNAWLQRLVHGCNELGAEGQSVASSWQPVANLSVWQQRQLRLELPPAAAAAAAPRAPALGALPALARMSMPHAPRLHAPLLSAADVAAARAPRRPQLPLLLNRGHSEQQLLAALAGGPPTISPATKPATPFIPPDLEQALSAPDPGPETGPRSSDDGWLAGVGSHVHSGWLRLPKVLVVLMLACWLVYVGLQLARTLSPTCSPAYWRLLAAQVVAMPAFSVAAAAWGEAQKVRRRRRRQQERAAGVGEPLLGAKAVAEEEEEGEEDEEASSWSTFLVYQLLALTAGVLGGLLGLGGGMIIGPVLLELGVHPQVSSATSSAMVLFSSSTALVSMAALGELNIPYAIAFSLASMFASVLGVVVIGCAIRSTGRVSLVVLTLAAVMLIGAVAVGISGAVTIMEAISRGELGPLPFCPPS